jgi:hypothetical protein
MGEDAPFSVADDEACAIYTRAAYVSFPKTIDTRSLRFNSMRPARDQPSCALLGQAILICVLLYISGNSVTFIFGDGDNWLASAGLAICLALGIDLLTSVYVAVVSRFKNCVAGERLQASEGLLPWQRIRFAAQG